MGHRGLLWCVAVLTTVLLVVGDSQVDQEEDLPVVAMTEDYVVVSDQQTVKVGVKLTGTIVDPVAVWLEVLDRGNNAPIREAAIKWRSPTQPSVQYVELPPANELFTGDVRSLQLVITSAANATVSDEQASATVSLDAEDSLPLLSYSTNEVAYPTDKPEIPVTLTPGLNGGSISVMYQITVLTPAQDQFLPQSAMSGFLQFDDSTTEQQISVPIVWDTIPPEAAYRLGLTLTSMSNVRIKNLASDVAVHIFGVSQGTCPPGSAVTQKSSSSNDAPAPGWWQDSLYADIDNKRNTFNSVLRVLVDERPVKLTVRMDANGTSGVDYGAMVHTDTDTALLCVEPQEDGEKYVVKAVEGPPATARGNADKLCCQGDLKPDSCSSSSPNFDAWEVKLDAGQNRYTVQQSTSSTAAAGTDAFTVSVVRLAQPSHALLDSLVVKDFNGNNVTLCTSTRASGPQVEGTTSLMWTKQAASAPAPETFLLPTIKTCKPDVVMSVNVSADSEVVALTPELLYPDIQGVRVEVNGQVLSRGGNVSADRVEDTTPFKPTARTNSSFLPTAFIMGLTNGAKVDVEVVVVAEDGVTSARYPVTVYRSPVVDTSAFRKNITFANATAVVYDSPLKLQQGWPQPPALNEDCEVCPAGWSSSTVNAKQCNMCPPGTFAQEAQSSDCLPCSPGSYAYSWGSTHCKHCIAGTYSGGFGSDLCKMCPANLTTMEDGQTSCNVTLAPATDLNERYAVVVSFSLYLTGTDRDAIVLRTGVNAPPESILGNLLRSDTATAFNISVEDVQILGITQVSRRVLQANVSATLGVDLPPGASEEDIAAALEVQKLSADKPIELLSEDPDAFFGRTTKTLEVGVQTFDASTTENRPRVDDGISKWALLLPGIMGVLGGAVLVSVGLWKTKACVPLRQHCVRWTTTMRIAPTAYRYSRQV